MFSDWNDGVLYEHIPLFYEEWDDRASEALIKADDELMRICKQIPEVMGDVLPICDYYEVSGIEGMTAKIRSIAAFRGIKAPMIKCGSGFVPDLTSRYFTEDIPYGTVPIKAIAELAKVSTPTIDGFIEWVQQYGGKKLLEKGMLVDDGCIGLPVPKNYGLISLSSILSNSYKTL
jgi:opine dehydrogenase